MGLGVKLSTAREAEPRLFFLQLIVLMTDAGNRNLDDGTVEQRHMTKTLPTERTLPCRPSS